MIGCLAGGRPPRSLQPFALFAFALLNNAAFWPDGSIAAGSLDPVRLLDSGSIVFFVVLYHHLNLAARQGFEGFRPVLKSIETDLRNPEYRDPTPSDESLAGHFSFSLAIQCASQILNSVPFILMKG